MLQMEDYLYNMKTLRSQMNDVEDHAAKTSVEEQMQITTIQTLEKDLESTKLEIQRVKADTLLMVEARGQICSQILAKQKKIASLESDLSTLDQTLELLQQEKISLSSKTAERSSYYREVADDLKNKLLEQQEWMSSRTITGKKAEQIPVKDKMESEAECLAKLDSAKSKLHEISSLRSNLTLENNEMKKSIEHMKKSIAHMVCMKPELSEMDIKALEEEREALLSDKHQESEFLKSLKDQIEKLKGTCQVIKCNCGVEYKVELGDTM